MGAEYPSFADVSGAGALLFLADSSPAPCPPPALSEEFSCHSGSSTSSYSGASVRSCVSDSAQRGRPVDPLRVLSVVASLRRVDPKVLAKATSALLHSGAAKKRRGIWIEIDSDEEEDQSERSSAVASEGSTVTAAASAGSTATSGRCSRLPRASDGGCGGKPRRRADAIMQWMSRPHAAPATENDIRAAVGDNSGTSKAMRWLLKQEGGLRRAGTGGPSDPYVYMIAG